MTTLENILRLSEQLAPAEQLRLIELLAARVRVGQKVDTLPVDILTTAGLGAELWQEIDVDAYLQEERASWER
jgi:hypothetical protein